MTAKKVPPLRHDTGSDHPLFAGMWTTYFRDQAWRKDIPKAGADSGWFVRQRKTAPPKKSGSGRISQEEGDN